MSVNDDHDLEGIRAAGAVAKHLRDSLAALARPGVTTVELDRHCAAELRAIGAVSAPMKHYQAPSFAFYSVNHVVVHGLPSAYELREGDLLKIDVTPEYAGYIADTACTVVVGDQARFPVQRRLARAAEAAFERSLAACRPGRGVNRLGLAIGDEVRRRGYHVIRELTGHGVGRAIHEAPTVANEFDPRQRDLLTEGLVIAIEPMIASLPGVLYEKSDGWSLATRSGTMTAHHEHTVLITNQGPIVLTA